MYLLYLFCCDRLLMYSLHLFCNGSNGGGYFTHFTSFVIVEMDVVVLFTALVL